MKHLVIGHRGFVGAETFLLLRSIKDFLVYGKDAEESKLGRTISKMDFDFAHICVPTPMRENGQCDTSIVKEVISQFNADIYIVRSTVPPGTCDEIRATGKKVVFQPEYVASSSPYPAPLGDMATRSFIILGGDPEDTKAVRKMYEKIYPPTCRIMECSAKTAEVIKYGENAYIASKVTFCHEFYNICELLGVDYDAFREGVFRLDPRMQEWWTYVDEDDLGWGGHCLPKDMSAIIAACEEAGFEPEFLKAVVNNNERHKGY